MKKNILVISPYNPFAPELGGSGNCVRNRLKHLSAFADVTLITFRGSNQDSEAAKRYNVTAIFIDMPFLLSKESSRIKNLLDILTGKLLVFCHYRAFASALGPVAQDIMKKRKFDLIQIEDIVIAPVTEYLPETVPRLVFFHNVVSAYLKSVYGVTRGIKRKIAAGLEYLWMKRYERRMLSKFDMAVALTEKECSLLRALSPSIPLHEIPLEVDMEALKPQPFSDSTADIAFFGTMSYPPNEEAVLYFIKSVFPLIKRKKPYCKFHVVGRCPGSAVRQCATEDVIITGEVKNVPDRLRSINIVVVPLLTGAGMRVKILEAFALSKTVISTSLGAEGIHYQSGVDIIIADDPVCFADAVCTLMDNPKNARLIGINARKLVEMKYGSDIVWKKWLTIYSRLFTDFCLTKNRKMPKELKNASLS
jgi:glycosyltransferase involved in cell wall biosynthesis